MFISDRIYTLRSNLQLFKVANNMNWLLAGAKCPHIGKAINLNKVKKNLKKTGILTECSVCKKLETDHKTTEDSVNDICKHNCI